MRRFIPLSCDNAFQHFSYIYIPGTRFYAPAAACACKIVQHLGKERELLIESIAHPFIKMLSRIMVAGDLGERRARGQVVLQRRELLFRLIFERDRRGRRRTRQPAKHAAEQDQFAEEKQPQSHPRFSWRQRGRRQF